jgi:hypothetical protein
MTEAALPGMGVATMMVRDEHEFPLYQTMIGRASATIKFPFLFYLF